MSRMHKHKGVLSNGVPKIHPVSQTHRDTYAKRCHQLELNAYNAKKPKLKVSESYKKKNVVGRVKEIFSPKLDNVSVDKDNYILIDLTKDIKQKGVRVKFVRIEGRTKRTVGLQIEK